MSLPATAPDVLNREFLEIRCKILEIAAALDRLDRAEGSVDADSRMTKLRQGVALLATDRTDRAEQVQLLFSIPFDDQWQKNLNVARRF